MACVPTLMLDGSPAVCTSWSREGTKRRSWSALAPRGRASHRSTWEITAMREQTSSHGDPQPPVGIPILFAIGVSAGFIAAVSPRLMAALSVRGSEGDITLFNLGFFLAAGAFA